MGSSFKVYIGGRPAVFSTTYTGTENPLSESGVWEFTAGSWTPVRKNGGIAYGTQVTGLAYDDSLAYLAGHTRTFTITSILSYDGSARSGATDSHEVEHCSGRFVDGTHLENYEATLGYSGATGFYVGAVKLNGTIGNFADISTFQNAPTVIVSGDEYKTIFTEVVGVSVTFNSYLNGVLICTGFDNSSPFMTRQPGIGFFWRATENVSDFAFTSTTVVDN